jgi:hypothetical protein
MYQMSGIFHKNIAFMLVSIAVIPIMASLNPPSLSTNIGSIRPRPNSPRLEAVVEAEVDAAAEVALLVEAVAMVVIKPTPAESGKAMMLRCLQHLPLMGKKLFCSAGKLSCYLFCHFCHVLPFLYGAEFW